MFCTMENMIIFDQKIHDSKHVQNHSKTTFYRDLLQNTFGWISKKSAISTMRPGSFMKYMNFTDSNLSVLMYFWYKMSQNCSKISFLDKLFHERGLNVSENQLENLKKNDFDCQIIFLWKKGSMGYTVNSTPLRNFLCTVIVKDFTVDIN